MYDQDSQVSNTIIDDFFRKLSIVQKLILSYLIIGFLSLFFVTFFYYDTAKKALINRTLEQLSSVMSLKRTAVHNYIDFKKSELQLFSSYYYTKLAFSEIKSSYYRFGLQSDEYVFANTIFGNSIRQFVQHHSLENIWFVDLNHVVFFTEKKNLYTGQKLEDVLGVDTSLLRLVHRAKKGTTQMDIDGINFPDSISRVLIGVPIYTDEKTLIGVILAKLKNEELSQIVFQHTGLGKTGESYIVDAKGRMRTRSRFIHNSNVFPIHINSKGYKVAQEVGVPIQGTFTDYRNKNVFGSYSPLTFPGISWVIISEMDVDEAIKPINELKKRIFLLSILFILVLILTTLVLARVISKPIIRVSQLARILSTGQLPEVVFNEINKIPVSKDEIGELNTAMLKLYDRLKAASIFANQIGKGNLDTKFEAYNAYDVLGTSLLQMRESLKEYAQLVDSQNKTRTQALIDGQESERRRIARDLHDGVGQLLTALKFKSQLLPKELIEVQELKDLLDETIKEVRRVSFNLMPAVLWEYGLKSALQQMVSTCSVPVHYVFRQERFTHPIPLDIRLCAYRVIQEGLNNAMKYAQTDRIDVIVLHKYSELSFRVRDYGIGFDTDIHKPDSNGIVNMHQRVAIHSGNIQINSSKGRGTTIQVHIPLPVPKNENN